MVAALLHRYSPTSSSSIDVAELPSAAPSHHQRLLICAPSNAAVDEILLRLSRGVHDSKGEIRKLKIVRLGEPIENSSHSSAILEMTLDSQVEQQVRQDQVWGKLQEVNSLIEEVEDKIATKTTDLNREMQNNNGGLPPSSRTNESSVLKALKVESSAAVALDKEVKALKEQLTAHKSAKSNMANAIERMRAMFKQSILSDADIVAATLSGAPYIPLT